MSAAIATPAPSPWDVTPEDLAAARTPIWDALYAEQDAETQRVVFNACADEHTEPVTVARGYSSPLWEANRKALMDEMATPLFDSGDAPLPEPDVIDTAVIVAWEKPKPKKKPTPRKPAAKKPAAKSPLAAQEAKLRTVRGRLADEFKTLGGNDAGEVNTLGIAFVCLLGLLLAPVIVAVFG